MVRRQGQELRKLRLERNIPQQVFRFHAIFPFSLFNMQQPLLKRTFLQNQHIIFEWGETELI